MAQRNRSCCAHTLRLRECGSDRLLDFIVVVIAIQTIFPQAQVDIKDFRHIPFRTSQEGPLLLEVEATLPFAQGMIRQRQHFIGASERERIADAFGDGETLLGSLQRLLKFALMPVEEGKVIIGIRILISILLLLDPG